jgi:hypothetical protein
MQSRLRKTAEGGKSWAAAADTGRRRYGQGELNTQKGWEDVSQPASHAVCGQNNNQSTHTHLTKPPELQHQQQHEKKQTPTLSQSSSRWWASSLPLPPGLELRNLPLNQTIVSTFLKKNIRIISDSDGHQISLSLFTQPTHPPSLPAGNQEEHDEVRRLIYH